MSTTTEQQPWEVAVALLDQRRFKVADDGPWFAWAKALVKEAAERHAANKTAALTQENEALSAKVAHYMEAYKHDAHALIQKRGELERVTQENQRLLEERDQARSSSDSWSQEFVGCNNKLAAARAALLAVKSMLEADTRKQIVMALIDATLEGKA